MQIQAKQKPALFFLCLDSMQVSTTPPSSPYSSLSIPDIHIDTAGPSYYPMGISPGPTLLMPLKTFLGENLNIIWFSFESE